MAVSRPTGDARNRKAKNAPPENNLPAPSKQWARWVEGTLKGVAGSSESAARNSRIVSRAATQTADLAAENVVANRESQQQIQALREHGSYTEEALSDANAKIEQAELDLLELNEVTLPGLEQELTQLEVVMDALDDVVAQHTLEFEALEQLPSDLAALGTRLDSAETELGGLDDALGVLNNTTLPGIVSDLQTQIDNIEVDGDGNTITTSTNAPSATTGYSEGDQWRRVIGTGSSRRIIGEWYFSGTAWIQTTIDNDVIEQIDAAKITTGYLNADRIEARALTADKIAANAITANEIATNAVTAVKVAADAITGNKILAGSITAADAVFANAAIVNANIASINAEKITAGFIASARIAANSITTEKLVIGSASNLIPNGADEMSAPAGWAGPLTRDTTDKPANESASFRSAAGQGFVSPPATVWDVEPGKPYRFEVWLKADKPNSRIFIGCRDVDGAHAGTSTAIPGEPYAGGGAYFVSNQIVPTTWTKYAGIWTPNAGVTRARIASIYFNHSNGTERGAVQSIAGMRLKPMAGATLIENGAITTEKVAANAITANKIAANAVTANKIAANTITSNEITTGDLVGLNITGGTITGTTITGVDLSGTNTVTGGVLALTGGQIRFDTPGLPSARANIWAHNNVVGTTVNITAEYQSSGGWQEDIVFQAYRRASGVSGATVNGYLAVTDDITSQGQVTAEYVNTDNYRDASGQDMFPVVQGGRTRTTVQTHSSSGTYLVQMNTNSDIPGGQQGVTIASGGLRVSRPGIYAVSWSMTITNSAGTTNAARISVNGADQNPRFLLPGGTTGLYRGNGTEMVRLGANSLVQLYATIAAASGGTVAGSTEFSIYRVGP